MSTTDHLPRHSLRARIELALSADPRGVTTSQLRDALDRRARALGDDPVGTHGLIRQLGLLLIEGRIDERAGVWVLCEGRVRIADPHDQAA